MESSGQSEFSGESKPVSINFWPSFLLTLSGASGLINSVANGPVAITYAAGAFGIASLVWIAMISRRNRK